MEEVCFLSVTYYSQILKLNINCFSRRLFNTFHHIQLCARHSTRLPRALGRPVHFCLHPFMLDHVAMLQRYEAHSSWLFIKTIALKKYSLLLILGVGIAMNFSNAYVTIYYNMLIAYAIYYLFKSFTSTLPWKYCSKPWASPSKNGLSID